MNVKSIHKIRIPLSGLLLIALLLSACGGQMSEQPRYEPLEPSLLFDDSKSARDLVDGTVARGLLRSDDLLYQGREDGQLAERFPFPVTQEVLERGQERYNIYCSVCHGFTGYGDGMIVQRGLRPRTSFHVERLRNAPVGHYYDVITNGFGRMYSYSSRIPPEDRWAIIAYVRALQLSQYARQDVLPGDDQSALEELPRERSPLLAERQILPTPTPPQADEEPVPEGDAAAGEELFQNLGCIGCHLMDGSGTGPSLVGIWGEEVQLEDGRTVTVTAEYVHRSIITPDDEIVAGYPPVMPSYRDLPEEQIEQLVAYVRFLGDLEQ